MPGTVVKEVVLPEGSASEAGSWVVATLVAMARAGVDLGMA